MIWIHMWNKDMLSASKRLKTQFVIITHDVEFVDELCRFASVDNFYFVKKNEQGYSTISNNANQIVVGYDSDE